jgi:hypothetical protein
MQIYLRIIKPIIATIFLTMLYKYLFSTILLCSFNNVRILSNTALSYNGILIIIMSSITIYGSHYIYNYKPVIHPIMFYIMLIGNVFTNIVTNMVLYIYLLKGVVLTTNIINDKVHYISAGIEFYVILKLIIASILYQFMFCAIVKASTQKRR